MSARRALLALRALALSLTVARCAKDPTALYVTVSAGAGATVRSLSVRVFQPPLGFNEGASMPRPSDVRAFVAVRLPVSFLVVPAADAPTATVQVDIEGFASEQPPMPPSDDPTSVFDRRLVTFQTDRVLDVPMVLRAGCTARTCAADDHCDEARQCVPATLTAPAEHGG